MKKTMYELLGMVKDELDKTNINIYVKYFDRLKERDDIMLACKENIIYKLDNSNIELNDEVEILEEPKGIPKRIQSNGENLYSEYIGQWLINKENYTEYDELLMNKINELIDYLESKGE